jgi:hypothetical protein
VSERRVKEALSVIKAAGVVTWARRPRKSNLYRLTTVVPETITPYAKKGRASKVLEAVTSDATRQTATRVTDSGHLGCLSNGTVTNQEPTMIDTGDELGSATKIEGSNRNDNVGAPWEPTIRLTRSARLLRDEILRGPVGEFFLEHNSIYSTADETLPGNRFANSIPPLFVWPSQRGD